MNPVAQNVVADFEKRYSKTAAVYYSPGRINLIGEHIDYNDGFVMPGAIDKGIYFAVALNNTDQINFYAVDFDETFSIKTDAIQKMDGWKNYVLSVANEFILAGKKLSGFDCTFGGNIANGAGISSSAAVEGGLAFAINELMDFGLERKQLALLCQRAEHNFPGVKCGIMDQYANLFGKKDHVILLDCREITHEYLPLQLTDSSILLINTKVHHSLASSAYNQRREQCEEGLQFLKKNTGINSFRDVEDIDTLLALKDGVNEVVYNRCLFVVEEILRTKKAAVLLKNNDIESFGKLMFQTHSGLRHLYNVSCPELDFLVDFAENEHSVIGARLMGGGFGGCTINIVKNDGKELFLQNITEAYKKAFDIDAETYEVALGNGTDRIG